MDTTFLNLLAALALQPNQLGSIALSHCDSVELVVDQVIGMLDQLKSELEILRRLLGRLLGFLGVGNQVVDDGY